MTRPSQLFVVPILLWICSSPEVTEGETVGTAAATRRFTEVGATLGLTRVHTGGTAEKGYIVEAKGGGAAWLDFDGDGDLDIYWANGSTLDDTLGGGNALYRNTGESGFVDVAKASGAEGRGWAMGALSADYDNDGDADLYVTNLRDNILYRNDGDAGFEEVGGEAGAAAGVWSTGAAFGDYDRDGDVDLYVAAYAEFDPADILHLGALWKGVRVFVGPMGLVPEADSFYRNDDGRFVDITREAGLAQRQAGYGFGVLFVDYDDDGDADLFVANDSSPNFLYRNDDGTFTEVGLQGQVAYGGMGTPQAGMGVAWGDYDGDAHADLFATHFEDDYNTLYRNEGAGLFVDATVGAGLGRASFHYVGFGSGFFDWDNDGDLDLLVANGHVYPQIERSGSGIRYAQPDQLFDNRGDGRFEMLLPAAGDSLGTARVSRGSAIADYDNDGDLDILVTNLNDRPTLLRNDVGNRQNWLGIRLHGSRSNRGGIGARLRLTAGGRVQVRDIICGSSFLSSEDPRAHFGLGLVETVDSLEVHWPSGTVQVLRDLSINQYLMVRESGGRVE